MEFMNFKLTETSEGVEVTKPYKEHVHFFYGLFDSMASAKTWIYKLDPCEIAGIEAMEELSGTLQEAIKELGNPLPPKPYELEKIVDFNDEFNSMILTGHRPEKITIKDI